MTAESHTVAPRHTGLAVVLVAAIPFISVTLAVRMGDAVSSASPIEAMAGLGALAVGVVMGLLVRRVGHALNGGFVALTIVLLRAAARGVRSFEPAAVARLASLRTVVVLHPAFVPAGTGRRGPPHRLR